MLFSAGLARIVLGVGFDCRYLASGRGTSGVISTRKVEVFSCRWSRQALLIDLEAPHLAPHLAHYVNTRSVSENPEFYWPSSARGQIGNREAETGNEAK